MTKQTVETRIFNHLATYGPQTDEEISNKLELPQASVRRTRNFLVMQGRVRQTSYLMPYTWELRPNGESFYQSADEAQA